MSDDPRQDLVIQRLQAELSDLLRQDTLDDRLIHAKKAELYDRITALWNDARVAKLSRCLNHRLAGIAVHAFKVAERPLNLEEIEAAHTAYTRMTMTHDGTFEMAMVDPTQYRVDRLRELVEELLAEQRGGMLPMRIPFNIQPFVAEVEAPLDDETFERIYYHLFGAPPNTTKTHRVEYMRGLYRAYLEDRSWDLREHLEAAPLEDANAVRTLLNGRVEMRGKKPL